jgi:hypothetical protein
LRKRLDAYFEGEGAAEPLRIHIPRGGYVPVFESVSGDLVSVAMTNLHVETESEGVSPSASDREILLIEQERADLNPSLVMGPESERKTRRRYFGSRWFSRWFSRPVWLAALGGLTIGVLCTLTVWAGLGTAKAHRDQPPAHAIWAQLFQPNRNTLIVPSDSGLGILQNLTRHLVTVEEYASGSYLSEMRFPSELDARNFKDLSRERYTSVVSLNITSMLTSLPEYIADRTQVRYARSITAEDIRNSNAILLGSKHTNPWVSLFDKRLNFRLEYTPQVNESYVLNTHPTGSEQSLYRNSTDANSNRTYGAIAYLPSLDGAGHVLIIQGLNMAATQAAADLLNTDAIKPVLEQARLPNGSLRPFELLIETTSIGATAPGVQLIATRIYP